MNRQKDSHLKENLEESTSNIVHFNCVKLLQVAFYGKLIKSRNQ